ncbi:MAG: ABC transporter permease subunit [Alphaproteobacteria bacterium]|nr:ABC transporter permease subunit [Alphaproteobacteria bacterium]
MKVLRTILRSAPALVLLLMAALCFSAGGLEHLLHLSATQTDLSARFLSPSLHHPFGTDALGRDVFMRLLYGGQVSLTVALAAGVAAAMAGTFIGMTAGWLGGNWDALLMRMTDLLIALPGLPLLIILSALDLQKLGFSAAAASSPHVSLYKIIALIALLGWTTVARLARARTLSLKEADYVTAARALGVSAPAILRRHIFPNLLDTVLVATALSVGNIILTESVLSFLGLGIQPPLPSWGNMLTNAEDMIWEHAALTIYPGALIFVTVLSFNFLGDRLQQAFDPKAQR